MHYSLLVFISLNPFWILGLLIAGRENASIRTDIRKDNSTPTRSLRCALSSKFSKSYSVIGPNPNSRVCIIYERKNNATLSFEDDICR